MYCACRKIYICGSRSAASATKSALSHARPSGAHPRRTTRAAADPGGSVYCACHKIYTPGSPSTAPGLKSTLQVHQVLCRLRNLHSAGQAVPSLQLSLLRLSQYLRCRLTKYCACREIYSPGSPSAAPATKSAPSHAAQRRPRAPQLIQEALCTAPATKSAMSGVR